MDVSADRGPPRPCAKLRSTWPETPAAVTRGRREVRLLGEACRKLREGVCSDYYVIGLGKYVFSPTCERNGSEREAMLLSLRGAQKCPFHRLLLIIYLNAVFAVRAPTPDIISSVNNGISLLVLDVLLPPDEHPCVCSFNSQYGNSRIILV